MLDILERFCAGFAARDAEAVVKLFAPDAGVVMVTSEEPLLRGPAEVTTFLRRYAEAAAEDREEKHPYRMSMVCEERDGRWLLLMAHGSSPHPG